MERLLQIRECDWLINLFLTLLAAFEINSFVVSMAVFW